MSRITKQMAEEIAMKLTVKKHQEAEAARLELQKYIHEYMVSKIPKAVMECFKKHKDYFSTSSSIQFCGNGFNYDSFSGGVNLPSGNNRIMPDDKTSKRVNELNNSYKKKKQELSQLRNEIEVSLCNLRTRNNIEKEFPEAFKLLPPAKICTSLTINIADIRKKLN